MAMCSMHVQATLLPMQVSENALDTRSILQWAEIQVLRCIFRVLTLHMALNAMKMSLTADWVSR